MKAHPASVALAACALLGWVCGPQPARAHAQATTTVQFDREIVRILDDHCVMCHADRGLAFPLVTYEQTYAARWQIRMDALDHHMAPWAAARGIGDFANDNSLTQPEIDFLASWAESFGPRNNGEVYTQVPATSSAPRLVQAHVDFDRWVLGKPDLLLTLADNKVSPGDAPLIRRTVIDPKLTRERWLRGLEYKPGDRRVVHAVSFTVQETGQWLGSWTPWHGFVSLPATLAYRLPAGSHIVAEIHYYGAQQPVVDQGLLGLYFSEAPSPRALFDVVLAPTSTKILDADLNLMAFQPQLAPGLQSIEVAARSPDGTRQVLLFARDIPLQWPTPYVFSKPIALTKGTQLSVIEHYGSAASSPPQPMAVTFSAYAGAALATGPVQAQPQPHPAPTPTRRYRLAGTVKSVDAAAERLVIQHGDIPGLMGAMTMSYDAGKHEDLRKVAAGDAIESDVVVNDAGTHLENIKITGHGK
ncbi:MAG TPA: copper-binding protein [Steroidobacteraceae bacterium]|nr:copper-binding protein [Steroidobacteraceae bacterium]